jgi:hypothetical protein
MKNIKYIAFAAVSAIASVHAQTSVYISGATAYRSTANVAIDILCGGAGTANSADAGNAIKAYDKSLLGDVTRGRWEYVTNSVTNQIFVRWSGSEAGIQNTAGGADGTASKRGADFYTIGQSGSLATTAALDNHASHICFSDTAQAASIFRGTKAGDGVNYATLSGAPVAIVGFTWFVNNAATNAGIRNITSEVARALITAGKLPVSFFTGLASDSTNGVYLFGRNPDSGTRVTTLLNMKSGTVDPIKQYYYSNNNTIYLTPLETINGISTRFTGNSGYNSGSTIAAHLANTLGTGTNLFISTNGVTRSGYSGANWGIGYIAGGDLSGKGGVTAINYNGVSMNTTNIINGSYPFWSKEYLYQNTSRSNAVSSAVFNAIKTASLIKSTDTGKCTVNLTNMIVDRTGDGASVTP